MEHDNTIEAHLKGFAEQESLPGSFIALAKEWYWPLSRELAKIIKAGKIQVLGISGSQGSGKSTLAKLLCQIFQQQDGLKVVTLSLDDFYLPLVDRQSLANDIHPLLVTRGVPGTHDIRLAIEVINSLLSPQLVPIPRFDKAIDDRLPPALWDKVQGPVDLIILEGWCLSIPPQKPADLEQPCNTLETEHDGDLTWRQHVNHALGQYYPSLFQLIDFLIYLRSPSFEAVCRWRGNQEQKLSQQFISERTDSTECKKIMDEKSLEYFMQHYQRLTMQSFARLPNIANVVFTLNEEQQINKRSDRQQ